MIHHGVFSPFAIGNPGALDSAFTLMPEYLKRLGFATHMIGKW
jgi:arylsulfatase A-like enzyme